MLQTRPAPNGDIPTMNSADAPNAASSHSTRESPPRFTAPPWLAMLQLVPDWRWWAADHLASQTAISGAQEYSRRDAGVSRAAEYIRQMRAEEAVSDHALAAADRIRRGDPLVQAEIDSRLLAQQTSETIAGITTMEPEVIKAYRQVFFDVGNRYTIPDSDIPEVADARSRFGLSTNEVSTIWKLCGSNSGQLLDELLSCVPREEVEMYGLRAYYRRGTSAPQSIRLAVALKCLHVDALSLKQKIVVVLLAARPRAKSSKAGDAWMLDVLASSGIESDVLAHVQAAIGGDSSSDPRQSQNPIELLRRLFSTAVSGTDCPKAETGNGPESTTRQRQDPLERLRRVRSRLARPIDPCVQNVKAQDGPLSHHQRINQVILSELIA